MIEKVSNVVVEHNKKNNQFSKKYLDTIFSISDKYLDKILTKEEKDQIKKECCSIDNKDIKEIIKVFSNS